jgi:hypothetical protein
LESSESEPGKRKIDRQVNSKCESPGATRGLLDTTRFDLILFTHVRQFNDRFDGGSHASDSAGEAMRLESLN